MLAGLLCGGPFCCGPFFCGRGFADESQSDESQSGESQLKDEKLRATVAELATGLQSGRFAERERASEQLYQLGPAALPFLVEIRNEFDQPEPLDRITRIVLSLRKQEKESRIESFLLGGASDVKNWDKIESWFGDNKQSRELYVELYREHPYLIETLGGSPQEVSLGLQLVHRRLRERGVGFESAASRTDVIAMMLPMVQPNFQPRYQYDDYLAGILYTYAGRDSGRDRVFGKPFVRLTTLWMQKSHILVRSIVLRLAMKWDLDITLDLAVETLQENAVPTTTTTAMQAVAKYGNRSHLPMIATFLDDPRVIYPKRANNESGTDVQMRDVAAATIAILCDVPVVDVGFQFSAEDEVFGLLYARLNVPPKKGIDGEADEENLEEDSEKDEEDPFAPVRPGPLGNQFGLRPQPLTPLERMRLMRYENRVEAMRQDMRAKVDALLKK